MSAAGRKSWTKSFPGDESATTMPRSETRSTPAVVGLSPKGSLSFFRSLPRACIGFLFAVLCDVVVMVAYGSVLLATGLGASSFYFAALTIAAGLTLVYFSISAIRSENTVELLAAVGIATCVNATVIYFRSNENAFSAIQRRSTNLFSSTSSVLPPEILNAGILGFTGLVQLALMGFGYLSYNDFGWRIFKLFGIDFNMRQVNTRNAAPPARHARPSLLFCRTLPHVRAPIAPSVSFQTPHVRHLRCTSDFSGSLQC